MGSKINSLDDDTSLGGTYLNLRAEGNLCYLKGKYYDAIEYFTRALELRYTDCDVFIRRGWCHLQLCNTKVALKDVEHAHTHVTPQHAGRVVFLRAEVLYTMGEFEQALVYFNRGRTQNPSEHKFVLGINKCREAITNCVGAPERIKLSLQGDLTYFKNLDENKKLRAAQGARTHMSASTTFNKYLKEQVASEKTIQQLLAQIYDDKVFLEKLITEAGRKMQYDDITVTLLTETLLYLKHRSLFWQKQNPIYSRRHDKLMRDRRRLCAVNNSNYLDKYLSKELEKVQNDIGNGHLSPGLRRASRCLNMLKNMDKDVPINRDAFNADVHGLIGRIYFEVNQLRKALTHCIKSKDLAIKSDVKACQLRALENLGRIYICQHDYKSAVQQWILKLDIIDDAEERAWLCHDIGRCYMEMEQFTEVLEYGEKALMESQDVTNKHALLSSKVLIAQAHAKLVDYVAAKEMYEKALSLAQYLGKKSTENLIQEALEKVSECAEAAEGALEYMSSHHGIDTCGQSTGLPTDDDGIIVVSDSQPG